MVDYEVTQKRTGVAQNHQGETHNKPRVEQNKTGNSLIFGHYNNSNINDSLMPPLLGKNDNELSTVINVVGVE